MASKRRIPNGQSGVNAKQQTRSRQQNEIVKERKAVQFWRHSARFGAPGNKARETEAAKQVEVGKAKPLPKHDSERCSFHHFLELPGELRNEIYLYALYKPHYTIRYEYFGTKLLPNGLLHANSQIRKECLAMFYSRNRFQAHWHEVNLFLRMIGPVGRGALRSLTVTYDFRISHAWLALYFLDSPSPWFHQRPRGIDHLHESAKDLEHLKLSAKLVLSPRGQRSDWKRILDSAVLAIGNHENLRALEIELLVYFRSGGVDNKRSYLRLSRIDVLEFVRAGDGRWVLRNERSTCLPRCKRELPHYTITRDDILVERG